MICDMFFLLICCNMQIFFEDLIFHFYHVQSKLFENCPLGFKQPFIIILKIKIMLERQDYDWESWLLLQHNNK